MLSSESRSDLEEDVDPANVKLRIRDYRLQYADVAISNASYAVLIEEVGAVFDAVPASSSFASSRREKV